jgi:hypothetical protein
MYYTFKVDIVIVFELLALTKRLTWAKKKLSKGALL